MSGKPIPTFSFAVETNYPAGSNAWSGTATKVAPVPDYFTPNVKPPAQWFNYLFNQIGTTITANFGWTANMAAQNWGTEQGLAGAFSSFQYFIGAAWDQYLSKWVVLAYAGPNSFVNVSYGVDGNVAAGWTQVGTTLVAATSGSICTDPQTVGDYYVATVNDDGTHNGTIVINHYNGSTWSVLNTLTLTSSGSNIQKPRLFRTGFIAVGGDPILLVGNNTGTHGAAVNPVCWNINGTINTQDPGFPANDWVFATAVGTTLGVIVPAFTSFALTAGQYLTTTTGSSFIVRTMSFLGTNDLVTAICWTLDATAIADGKSGCFLLAVYNTGTTKTRFYRSEDGISWTATGAPTAAFEVADLAAVGSLVVATLMDASSGGPSGQVWSPDGGATWYFGQATFTSNVANTGATFERSRVVAGSQGFMAMNPDWFRFSVMQGTPTSAL